LTDRGGFQDIPKFAIRNPKSKGWIAARILFGESEQHPDSWTNHCRQWFSSQRLRMISKLYATLVRYQFSFVQQAQNIFQFICKLLVCRRLQKKTFGAKFFNEIKVKRSIAI
jgi:hypothetical protein